MADSWTEMSSASAASGKSLAISVRDSDTVQEVKRKYSEHSGIPPHRISLTFCEEELEDHRALHECGIASGDLHLVSLGLSRHSSRPEGVVYRQSFGAGTTLPQAVSLAAVTMAPHTDQHGDTDAIIVTSKMKPKYPDLKFKTIRLSCESHLYSSSEENYAGFILYAWTDEEGVVRDDWVLNGKHCKSAYLVVQSTDSDGVNRYTRKAPGQVHGAVYWNVFGEGAVVRRAVGEGFSLQNGKYGWNSVTFNANADAYHDGRRQISILAKKCVKTIMDDWKRNSRIGKTYYVKHLLN